ncbi:RNA methyltransferase [Desulfospira joergensenii]|uniref:RNA methyltransferase n=1 Tax=Desulfospira joergensenii TaxID=53329 RepID=UPI0003B525C9|nr:RNA methyltransferase [Desulfospira joergensenii]
MKPENLIVILVRPQGPINIGSCCRAMMNFGFKELRLVAPCKSFKGLQAKKMALGAFPILETAGIFPDLASALHDVNSAFGTTRRFGKYRKNFFTPATAAARIAETEDQTRCALVMGPEDTGLETKDLDLCQHFITIPTHDDYSSMNLSHALSVLLYEISLKTDAVRNFSDPSPKKIATGQEMESMFAHMRKTLLDIDYLDPQNPDHLLRAFRRIFGTAGLTSRDVRIIRGLMSRIDWTEDERRKHDPAFGHIRGNTP